MKKNLLLLIMLCMALPNSIAEIVYLKNGQSTYAKLKKLDDEFSVFTGTDGNDYKILTNDILKIEGDSGKIVYEAPKNEVSKVAELPPSKYGYSTKLTPKRMKTDDKTVGAQARHDVSICSWNKNLAVGGLYELLTVSWSKDKSLEGCPIVCQIMERRKSNISGAEGRLVIRPLYIVDKEGNPHYLLPTDIYRRGKNFTNGKFWLSIVFFPAIFVAGTKAEIKSGEVFDLRLE